MYVNSKRLQCLDWVYFRTRPLCARRFAHISVDRGIMDARSEWVTLESLGIRYPTCETNCSDVLDATLI